MESKVEPELYNESVSGKNFPKIMINEKKNTLHQELKYTVKNNQEDKKASFFSCPGGWS